MLAGFKLEYWYHLFIALGAGAMVAALTVDVKGITNLQLLMIGGALLLVGTGEWINHPFQTRIVGPADGFPGFGKVTGHPRNNNALGVIFVLLGLCLGGLAIYSIATS